LLIEYARQLRKNMTPTEKNYGMTIFDNILSAYIVKDLLIDISSISTVLG
jgi:hypothetical protein